ncbi:uncharacterized protein LOC118412086 [Branchiostoma floridae]|uniref:Uncharacterized protein LOC118412086 n=1 Tax=Branchiostoma floridae TaxID=7739 RepID=A0A9J7MKN6_BRAFL|nr:uncharacterized protein LOC118412086 [Branchiostoma floridae]
MAKMLFPVALVLCLCSMQAAGLPVKTHLQEADMIQVDMTVDRGVSISEAEDDKVSPRLLSPIANEEGNRLYLTGLERRRQYGCSANDADCDVQGGGFPGKRSSQRSRAPLNSRLGLERRRQYGCSPSDVNCDAGGNSFPGKRSSQLDPLNGQFNRWPLLSLIRNGQFKRSTFPNPVDNEQIKGPKSDAVLAYNSALTNDEVDSALNDILELEGE